MDLNDLNDVLNRLGTNVGTNAFHPGGGESLADRIAEFSDFISNYSDPLSASDITAIQNEAVSLGLSDGYGGEALAPAIAPVPEPTTLGMFAAGASVLIRRRRRISR